MKKNFGIFVISVLLIVVMLSMTACGVNNGEPDKFNDLQTRFEQQEENSNCLNEELKRQSDEIKGLREKIRELEERNKGLEERISKLEESNRELEKRINKITNSIPHEVGIVACESFWSCYFDECKAKVVRSKAELTSHLSELDEKLNYIYGDTLDDTIYDEYEQYDDVFPYYKYNDKYNDIFPSKWGMKYVSGRFECETGLNGDKISEWYSEEFFTSRALIFCYFYSPNLFIGLTGTNLYIADSTLMIEINFTMSDATAIDCVMVVLEVDNSYIDDITECNLKTSGID